MSSLIDRRQLERETLLADWQMTGAAGTAWPPLAHVVKIRVIEDPLHIFRLAYRAGDLGLHRQIAHKSIHDEAIAVHFTDPLGYTNVEVVRPGQYGTGNLTTDHNMVIMIPPHSSMAGDPPTPGKASLTLIEIGHAHAFEPSGVRSNCYREFGCTVDGCELRYGVDSGD